MPSSTHRTRKAANAKAKQLEKMGKTVRFDVTIIGPTKRAGKTVKGSKKRTEYKITWRK